MSNDIAQARATGSDEKLTNALTLRGKITSLIGDSQRLLDAKRPENPRPRRLSQQPFDPERTLLTFEQIELYE
jgi:hypothetical protein